MAVKKKTILQIFNLVIIFFFTDEKFVFSPICLEKYSIK